MGIISRLFMYALVLALVAALGLWVMGGYKAENSGSIEIKATPEQIFQVLSDPDERQKWLLNATRVEMKSKPPLGPKTTYVTQQLVEGKDQPSEDSVQQIKEPEWLSIRMETAASTLITMFEISRVGDQSRLNYRASQVPNQLYR
ncbi:MAG: SRPBCC domain-containing protein, partial [Planctomycetota bacterium]